MKNALFDVGSSGTSQTAPRTSDFALNFENHHRVDTA
jgi:hypothetical protein